jgi:hypothetical protein
MSITPDCTSEEVLGLAHLLGRVVLELDPLGGRVRLQLFHHRRGDVLGQVVADRERIGDLDLGRRLRVRGGDRDDGGERQRGLGELLEHVVEPF